MVTNLSDNVFIVSVKGLFFLSESKYAVHFRSIFEQVLMPYIHLTDVIEPCESEISVTGHEFPLLFSLQMTEGRLCQVQLLDDRKLELLVQV